MALDDSVAGKLLALNDAFEASGLPFAFGGAIALAYCIDAPRATHDLDINVFVPPTSARTVAAALPVGLAATRAEIALLERDGQVRLRWDETPVDIFLSTDPFHDDALAHVRRVPFVEGVSIPVLGCLHLAVFKTFFNRRKDFTDIASMASVQSFDVDCAREIIVSLLGDDAARVASFDAAVLDGETAPEDPMGGRFQRP